MIKLVHWKNHTQLNLLFVCCSSTNRHSNHQKIGTIYFKDCLDKSAVNYLYFGFFDLFKSILSNYRRAAKNYWASCWEYPANLDFLAPMAFFNYAGVSDLEDELLIILIILPYDSATLALDFISSKWCPFKK